MHALHRRDLRPTLVVTMLAATLAIIAILVSATSLTDLSPGSTSASTRVSAAAPSHPSRAASASNPFATERLTQPLGARIRLPWGPADRSAPTGR